LARFVGFLPDLLVQIDRLMPFCGPCQAGPEPVAMARFRDL
jgi:hypothetical protein